MINTFKIFRQFYSEGGFDIFTSLGSDTPSPENGRELFIQTIIQPDADIIIYLPKEAIDHPEVWEAHIETAWKTHLKKTEDVARSIYRFRMSVKRALRGLSVVGVLLVLKSLYDYIILGEGAPYIMFLGSFMSLFPSFLKYGVMFYMKRKTKS